MPPGPLGPSAREMLCASRQLAAPRSDGAADDSKRRRAIEQGRAQVTSFTWQRSRARPRRRRDNSI